MDEKLSGNDETISKDDSLDGGLNDVEDVAIMAQMGKKQQLARRFNYIQIFALSATLLASWESIAETIGSGLGAGGPVALVYGYLFVVTGALALSASIAEMASMCPISGAQYHWTFMFAPPKWKIPITFMQGWITTFAWQATITSAIFLSAAQIQGLVILNWPDYIFERWHTTLMMWLLLAISFALNNWGIGVLPTTELFAGICHILVFFVLSIVMLVLGHDNGGSAEFVFSAYINETGWKSNGVAWFIGLLPSVWSLVGFDGVIHMSEETTKSAHTIPKVIVLTVVINGIMGFLFLLVLLFSISDIGLALSTPTGYPIIEIFRQVTGSKKSATLMEAAVLSITLASDFATLTSVSRLTWAFARDNGLPFSSYFAHVNSRFHIPTRAIALVVAVIFLLSFINIGSSVALNAILSLSTIALYVSYIVPISCLLHKRFSTNKDNTSNNGDTPLIFGPWTLGRYGTFVNIYALCYACLIVPFLALPSELPVTAETMNYAGPVFLGVLVVATLDYLGRGRKSFKGPAREIG